jgi:1,4-dihydroxy-2-naphthoyl-CoA hydrolase
MDLVQQINENMLPFGKLLGITCISATPDEVVGEMVVRDDLCTRPEILHGGAVMSLATPIHKGRSTMGRQNRISNEKGRLVALVTQTQMVLNRA